MKKKKIISIACAAALCFSGTLFSGCLYEREQDIDTSKTQIYVACYDSGVDTGWIKDQAAEWNKTNDKYEILIKDLIGAQTNNIIQELEGEPEKTTPTVYYTGEPGFQTSIYGDRLEDLSDVLNSKVDGETNGTIKDKMGNTDDYYDTVWKAASSKFGEGCYMLPYCDNFGGLIFNYDDFVKYRYLEYAVPSEEIAAELEKQKLTVREEEGGYYLVSYEGDDRFFNYKAGDRILSAGKDGDYGTYDDGQPTDIAGWEKMLTKIKGDKKKAFYWGGGVYGYVDMLTQAMMAQYSGLDEYNTYFDFEGTVTVGGTAVAVTPETGYKVYGMDGYGKALGFINDYLFNADYRHSDNIKKTLDQRGAQDQYILGYRQQSNEPMMLVDGEWFENEARAMLNTETVKNDGRGKGECEYRFMLLPNLDDNCKGVDGEGNGSFLTVLNAGAIIVRKTSDKAKLDAAKDFIKYTLKDENLRKFTVRTGITNGYRYSLTDADLAEMTPFARNVYSMYNDTENIGLVRTPILYAGCAMRFTTKEGFYKQAILFVNKGDQYQGSIKAFNAGVTPAQLAESAKIYYKHAGNASGLSRITWETMLGQAKTAGFYK